MTHMARRIYSTIFGILLLFLAGCSGSSSPSDPNTLIVTISSDKTNYTIGETMYVTVQASEDCYLTLYNVTADGKESQIFPNQWATDNQLTGGQSYRIPSEDDKFAFSVSGPVDTETIRAEVTSLDSTQQATATVSHQVSE